MLFLWKICWWLCFLEERVKNFLQRSQNFHSDLTGLSELELQLWFYHLVMTSKCNPYHIVQGIDAKILNCACRDYCDAFIPAFEYSSKMFFDFGPCFSPPCFRLHTFDAKRTGTLGSVLFPIGVLNSNTTHLVHRNSKHHDSKRLECVFLLIERL